MFVYREIGVEQVVDLLQVGTAVHEDLALADPDDRFVGNVQLVCDLTDQLLQDVLKRNDAVGAAVLVDHHANVNMTRPELPEQLDQGYSVRDEERFPGQRSQFLVVSPGDQCLVGIPYVQHTCDVIHGLAEHRNAAVGHVTQFGRDPAQLPVCRPGEDFGARCHHFPGSCRIQGERPLDQLPFVCFDRPGLVAQLRERPDLRFGHAGDRDAAREDESTDGLERQDDRQCQSCQPQKHRGYDERQLQGMGRGKRLRDDLAEEQHEQSHSPGRDSDACRTERLGRRVSRDRRSADVRDVVADEQRDEKAFWVRLQSGEGFCTANALLGQCFRSGHRHREQCDLRSREHAGQEHEEAKQEGDAGAHGRTT